MKKYKITETKNGFIVWVLKDFGNGYAMEDVKIRFKTKESAEKFIEQMKRGEEL